MREFLQLIFSPGMLLYTSLLIIVVCFWAITLLGMLDIHFLDFDFLHGHDVGDIGHDVGDAGGVDGHDMGDVSHDVGDVSLLQNVLGFLNIGTVPVTIVISFLVFFMWVLAFIGNAYVGKLIGAVMPPILMGLVVLAISFVLALYMTALATRPFRKLFIVETRHGAQFLVGSICIVTSTKVTGDFGTAEVKQRGSPLNLDIVCEDANELKRGGEAVIVSYDTARNLYTVRPL